MGVFKSKPKKQEPEKQQAAATTNGANRDRITKNDQAILDIKGRVRKLKNYEEKLAG